MLKYIKFIGLKLLLLIILLILMYSVLIKSIDVFFSILSLTPNIDVVLFITEYVIPNLCGVISIAYCIKILLRKFINVWH